MLGVCCFLYSYSGDLVDRRVTAAEFQAGPALLSLDTNAIYSPASGSPWRHLLKLAESNARVDAQVQMLASEQKQWNDLIADDHKKSLLDESDREKWIEAGNKKLADRAETLVNVTNYIIDEMRDHSEKNELFAVSFYDSELEARTMKWLELQASDMRGVGSDDWDDLNIESEFKEACKRDKLMQNECAATGSYELMYGSWEDNSSQLVSLSRDRFEMPNDVIRQNDVVRLRAALSARMLVSCPDDVSQLDRMLTARLNYYHNTYTWTGKVKPSALGRTHYDWFWKLLRKFDSWQTQTKAVLAGTEFTSLSVLLAFHYRYQSTKLRIKNQWTTLADQRKQYLELAKEAPSLIENSHEDDRKYDPIHDSNASGATTAASTSAVAPVAPTIDLTADSPNRDTEMSPPTNQPDTATVTNAPTAQPANTPTTAASTAHTVPNTREISPITAVSPVDDKWYASEFEIPSEVATRAVVHFFGHPHTKCVEDEVYMFNPGWVRSVFQDKSIVEWCKKKGTFTFDLALGQERMSKDYEIINWVQKNGAYCEWFGMSTLEEKVHNFLHPDAVVSIDSQVMAALRLDSLLLSLVALLLSLVTLPLSMVTLLLSFVRFLRVLLC